MNIYRIIDANKNRASEGLRVLEDIARFVLDNPDISKELREIRHQVRKNFSSPELLHYRNSIYDVGFKNSQRSSLDKKETLFQLIEGNFKRVQEALRSIEEALKILGFVKESKLYETLRFKSYILEKKLILKKIFPDTDIYGILGEEFSKGRTNIEMASEMIKAGIKIIQYREKSKSKLKKLQECKRIKELTKDNEVIFIINDDIDIALTIKADGIHIGQDDLPLREVKRIAGDMIIGVSTHNEDQAKKALMEEADYIGVGPIYNTTTKKDLEKSQGLKYLKWVSENITIPYVAIGGIKESNILEVKDYGGKCYAMISEIVGAEDVTKKVSDIRSKLNSL